MFLPVPLPLLLVVLFYASSIVADPLHIPLSRRVPATERTIVDKAQADAEYIRAKYGYNKVDSRRAVSGVPLINQVGIISYIVECHLSLCLHSIGMRSTTAL